MSTQRTKGDNAMWWERRRPNELTPDYLGRVLDELGFEGMADRARRGHFDDYCAPPEVADGMELLRLYNELHGKSQVVAKSKRDKVRAVMEAVKTGEFDATKAESDRWAASKEGQETMALLMNRDSNA